MKSSWKTIVSAAVVALTATVANATTSTGTGLQDGVLTYTENLGAPLVAAHLYDGGASAHFVDPTINALTLSTNIGGNLYAQAATTNAGWINFNFSASDALVAIDSSTINPTGNFLGLQLFWCNDLALTSTVGPTTSCSNGIDGAVMTSAGILSTFFNTGQSKTLVATWTGVASANSNLDFAVYTSAVPVPAAGLLLLGGLGGLAALRRKRKSKVDA